MKTADVSFVIPCYNHEKLIGLAIESALKQSVKPLEVIVVDDGSSDGSVDVIRRYGEAVILVSQPNRGRVIARSEGVRKARGKWIALLDGDDEAFPDRLEKQLAAVDTWPEAVIICGQLIAEDRSDGRIARGGVMKSDYPVPDEVNLSQLFRHNCIHTSSAMIRTNTTREILKAWQPLGRELSEDYGLWLLITTSGNAVHLKTPLGIYRMLSPDSDSRTLLFQRGAFLSRENVVCCLREMGRMDRLPGDWKHILYNEATSLGWMESQHGDPRVSRRWFTRAVAYNPASGAAWGRWLLSTLPPMVGQMVRKGLSVRRGPDGVDAAAR